MVQVWSALTAVVLTWLHAFLSYSVCRLLCIWFAMACWDEWHVPVPTRVAVSSSGVHVHLLLFTCLPGLFLTSAGPPCLGCARWSCSAEGQASVLSSLNHTGSVLLRRFGNLPSWHFLSIPLLAASLIVLAFRSAGSRVALSPLLLAGRSLLDCSCFSPPLVLVVLSRLSFLLVAFSGAFSCFPKLYVLFPFLFFSFLAFPKHQNLERYVQVL